jgi:hypothetical protein
MILLWGRPNIDLMSLTPAANIAHVDRLSMQMRLNSAFNEGSLETTMVRRGNGGGMRRPAGRRSAATANRDGA